MRLTKKKIYSGLTVAAMILVILFLGNTIMLWWAFLTSLFITSVVYFFILKKIFNVAYDSKLGTLIIVISSAGISVLTYLIVPQFYDLLMRLIIDI